MHGHVLEELEPDVAIEGVEQVGLFQIGYEVFVGGVSFGQVSVEGRVGLAEYGDALNVEVFRVGARSDQPENGHP
jgi:hypothetical protein